MAKKDFHSTIRIPTDLADALRAYAFTQGSSFNAEVTHAIYEYLKTHVPTNVDETMKRAIEREVGLHLSALKKVEEM